MRPWLAPVLATLLTLVSAVAHARVPTGFRDSVVVAGLDHPVSFAFLPTDRVILVEQFTGKIRLVINGQIAATDPVATVTGLGTEPEQGLLGIAVDPQWPLRPYVYVHYDVAATDHIRIARFNVTGDLAGTDNGNLSIDTASRFDLIDDIRDVAGNHNGGTARFGPDGMLYVSIGDDAAECRAQDITVLEGKILRLRVSTLPDGPGSATRDQITPADNPFVTNPNPNARLVYAFGLRNPFRFHVDMANGDLYVADVGQTHYEEMNRATGPGLNFGWPFREGPADYHPTACGLPSAFEPPIYSYDRTGFTAAIISGGIYREPVCIPEACCGFPCEYDGNVFLSDYYAGFLRRLVRNGSTWSIAPPVAGQPTNLNWGDGFEQVSDYLVGPEGDLWYCRQSIDYASGTGRIQLIAPPDAVNPPPPPPPPTAVEFVPPYPSPGRGSVTIAWVLPSPARVELVILDPNGREVAELQWPADLGATRHERVWNGRDRDGKRAPAGIYFARLVVDGREFSRRFPFLP